MQEILIPTLILGAVGALLGVILGIASRIFKVEQDERIPKIVSCLPGANCGGCGFAGCTAFATAVVEGKAKPNGCPVGGESAAKPIAEIIGVEVGANVPQTAIVLCHGSRATSDYSFEYYGISGCAAAVKVRGGNKACPYGCIGLGTCKTACKFGAIEIIDGLSVIDKTKCKTCGMCVKACPKNLIQIRPVDYAVVRCSSVDKGGDVLKYCKAGCVGCGICAKICPVGAAVIENNLAKVDVEKCTNCGACAEKCPKKTINKV